MSASTFAGNSLVMDASASQVALRSDVATTYRHQFQVVDIAPPGHAIRVTWQPVPGATGVEVTTAELRISPEVVTQSLGDLLVRSTDSNTQHEVTIPAGKLIRALLLKGLKTPIQIGDTQEDVPLRSSADLRSVNRRLIVTIPDPATTWTPPLYSVPAVSGRGMLPPALVGASFEAPAGDGLLTLPDLRASKIRLTIVEGEFPENFQPRSATISSVTGTAALPARDLVLISATGEAAWAFPGEFPAQAPPAFVDLRFALEAALNAALAAGQPLDVTWFLRGEAPGNAGIAFDGARGFVVREFPGVLRTSVDGVERRLDIQGSLADEQPASARADLTVRYDGIRILESVSDVVPASNGGVNGIVVRDQTVTHTLAPQALSNMAVARIGLIGRAPVETELSVQLVDLSTGGAGVPLGPPGVLRVQADAAIGTVWVEIPELSLPAVPLGIAVRANLGRFFWAANPAPLVRIAIYDPDPGGRPLRLADTTVLHVTRHELQAASNTLHLPAFELPAAAFRSSAPSWESDLFLTVDLSDLVLRYQR